MSAGAGGDSTSTPDDLTEDVAPSPGTEATGVSSSTVPTPYGLGVVQRRKKARTVDDHRFLLALITLVTVGAVGLLTIGAALRVSGETYERLKDIAPIIYGPLTTLAGTSFAWFYATRGGGD